MSNPLFVADLDTMKAELRLSGMPAGQDADTILGDVLLQVRLGFHRKLGSTRVGQLAAIVGDDADPTTNDELLHALAKTIEVKWTWALLAERLPQLWMDDSGGAWQQYNEQGTFRKLGLREREAQRARYLDEIEQAMQILSGDVAFGDESSIKADTWGNDDRPDLGDSIFGCGASDGDSLLPVL